MSSSSGPIRKCFFIDCLIINVAPSIAECCGYCSRETRCDYDDDCCFDQFENFKEALIFRTAWDPKYYFFFINQE